MANSITSTTGSRAASPYASRTRPRAGQAMRPIAIEARLPRQKRTTCPTGPKPSGTATSPMAGAATRAASVIATPRPTLGWGTPACLSFSANQMPNSGTSHAMPTTARPPPASRLKKRGDHWSISPARRSAVTASVMTAGTAISGQTAGPSSGVLEGMDHRLEQAATVRATQLPLRRPLRMGHEPDHVARRVADARDRARAAVGVRVVLERAAPGRVAEHDLPFALQPVQLRVGEVEVALAVRDRHGQHGAGRDAGGHRRVVALHADVHRLREELGRPVAQHGA